VRVRVDTELIQGHCLLLATRFNSEPEQHELGKDVRAITRAILDLCGHEDSELEDEEARAALAAASTTPLLSFGSSGSPVRHPCHVCASCRWSCRVVSCRVQTFSAHPACVVVQDLYAASYDPFKRQNKALMQKRHKLKLEDWLKECKGFTELRFVARAACASCVPGRS